MKQRVLFDQGVPVPLKQYLESSTVDTVYERGWSTLENGDLINKADAEQYDCFVTADKNLKYQQNLSDRSVAIAVLPTPSWPVLKNHVDCIAKEIAELKENDFREILLDSGT